MCLGNIESICKDEWKKKYIGPLFYFDTDVKCTDPKSPLVFISKYVEKQTIEKPNTLMKVKFTFIKTKIFGGVCVA